ncbi:MAG: trypsin-like peptidase domain-containing protein [Acetobacteraceae bacterium]|nr:trypsin-like peptidase domain-containing protein [Acetobacteraceae bacterium]
MPLPDGMTPSDSGVVGSRLRRCIRVVAPMALLFVLAGALPGQAARLAPARLPDVVEQVMPTVVAITATHVDAAGGADGQPAKVSHERGSGFVIDADGFIVTNKHVIDGATDIRVRLRDGTTLPAMLVGQSEKTDIALLQVRSEWPLPTARFGDSDKVRVGDDVIAIGNPLGFYNSVSAGIVSALNRDIMESPFDDYIQTDAAINHGSSGGPLFNMSGEVIGMNSIIFAFGDYSGSIGLGFAIPSDQIRFVVDQIRKNGYVRAGFMGIQFQDLTERLKDSLGLPAGAGGAIVVEVASDGPATKTVRLGDVVLQVGKQRITDARALARAIATAQIGAKTPVEVWRNNTVLRFDVVATVAPDVLPSGAGGPAFPKAAADRMAQGLGLTLAAADAPAPSGASRAGIPPGGPAAASPGTASSRAASPGATAPGPVAPGAAASGAGSPIASQAAQSGSEAGARVMDVAPSGAASDAGLAVGDVILMTDRGPVADPQDLMRALQSSRMNGRAFTPLLVRRKDSTVQWLALSSQATN